MFAALGQRLRPTSNRTTAPRRARLGGRRLGGPDKGRARERFAPDPRALRAGFGPITAAVRPLREPARGLRAYAKRDTAAPRRGDRADRHTPTSRTSSARSDPPDKVELFPEAPGRPPPTRSPGSLGASLAEHFPDAESLASAPVQHGSCCWICMTSSARRHRPRAAPPPTSIYWLSLSSPAPAAPRRLPAPGPVAPPA